MKLHRLFVERAPILRVCPMFCPAPLFSSCVHPIRYLHFYLLVRIAFIRHCLHFTSFYRVLHETTFIGEHTVESVNLKGSLDNSIDLVINDSEVPAGWRFQPINRIGIRWRAASYYAPRDFCRVNAWNRRKIGFEGQVEGTDRVTETRREGGTEQVEEKKGK